MKDAELQHFRDLAAAMQPEPIDWEWIGPHASQRLFGITEHRAKLYKSLHGGTASQMGAVKITIVEADRPEDDRAPPVEHEFMECDTCRAKPGSPRLCAGCLHNRQVISELLELTRKKS